ncbi:MAG: glycoside hydrolase family 81 [Planctomycetes bacterium]|nr:glycoside hydrolase family 81 [Planctomycetota bacterium]
MKANLSHVLMALLPCSSPIVADGIVKVGLGSYATQPPPGAKGPPEQVWKTEGVKGPLPTNRWWSSLLWTKHSLPQYAHPLAVCAQPGGLRVCYPAVSVAPIGIMGGMPGGADDLVLGHSGVAEFPDAKLAGWSDWFVTASFAVDGKEMRVSYGHGSPFVYAMFKGGSPKVTLCAEPKVWSGDAASATLGLSVRGKHYALFAPSGSAWAGLGTKALTCDAKGRTYFSLALLPDAKPETLRLFVGFAQNHVADTRVAWAYDPAKSEVTTTFAFTTVAREGKGEGTLFALYPHQWMRESFVVRPSGRTGEERAEARTTNHSYRSVRGEMKLAAGTGFTTRSTFHGVLPVLPILSEVHWAKLLPCLEEELNAKVPGTGDTYWEGKRLGKLATLVAIGEQADPMFVAALIAKLRPRLEGWLSASDAQGKPKSKGLFAYNRTWGTLIGYPASYGSDDQLNDHHFHYGYFLRAAAELARRDPNWAAGLEEHRRDARAATSPSDGGTGILPVAWGGMLRLIIRDIASPNRDDSMFPFLRSFDCYAGHSWASGHARFGDGNNQESSSEAMNAWTALILLGEAVGDAKLRDLGIWLYSTELEAINAYWFDVTGTIRPKEYPSPVLTMLWGGKGVRETWFSNKPEIVYGINWLPFHGGSLYLGLHPEYVKRCYDGLAAVKGGKPFEDWADLVLMYRALGDAPDALRQLDARGGKLPIEAGNSRANLVHWLHALAALGQVDRTVTADYPLYAVFRSGKGRAYVVYNAGATPRPIRFSDGTVLSAAPRAFTIQR